MGYSVWYFKQKCKKNLTDTMTINGQDCAKINK